MIHPDIKKAIELVTKHAGHAYAGKAFANLLGAPTPEKELDEKVKDEMLNHNAINGEATTHADPEMGSGEFGDSADGIEEPKIDGPEDEHLDSMPAKLGMMSTIERKMPMPHGLQETAKRRRGRPRKVR